MLKAVPYCRGLLCLALGLSLQNASASPPRFSANGVVNAASYTGGPIAPGELITIFGTDLGPQQSATMQLTFDGAFVTKNLAGVRVFFDGMPAPMVFASATQLSALVPYAVAIRATTNIQVEYNGVGSDAVSVSVSPSRLGVFTANASGAGNGAMLNQDGSVNGPANYASGGSVIVVYATGAGLLTNTPADGSIAGLGPSFPVVGVTATVNSIPADILYAGSAPGLVSGILQVNVRLPAQVPLSSASVVLSGNNTSSQANVTVATDRMAPLMRGSRILGIDVNMAENNSYNDALQISRGAGSGAVSLSLNWDGIETQPGHYDLTYLIAEVATLRGTGVSLSLRIRPVDTNGSHIPADLQSRPFSDPAVIQRFRALMDAVMTTLQGVPIVSIAIGNEVDVVFGANVGYWLDYKGFYDGVLTYLHARYPQVKFGVTVSFAGLSSYATGLVAALNQMSDVIMVNDYPLASGYIVRDPSSIRTEFDTVARLYANRPIHFTEIGYPSSPVNLSSDQLQRQFVDEVFNSWDAYSQQIEYLSFSWLTDLSQQAVDGFQQYYGITSAGFKEFLRTLGLRTYPGSGSDKPAFVELKTDAAARGWIVQ